MTLSILKMRKSRLNNMSHLDSSAHDAPVLALVDGLLSSAVEQGASDIHIDPAPGRLRVRIRIDGMLHDIQTIVDEQLVVRLVARLKILAGMDITQKRLPQDGKFSAHLSARGVDFRVSTFPVLHGEKVAIRILDRAHALVPLEKLGFSPYDLSLFKTVLEKPQGCILVCGPTGSGKTTTLYSALNYINTPSKNIMTLEDPIEYELSGIAQASIATHAGFSFASGMRSVVRHDPDVIMVGEIRDPQTAAIAHQAALTGHLVLSTIHTNDSLSVITRLADLSVEPYIMSATLTAVISQRLVRVLCTLCKKEQKPTAAQERMYARYQQQASVSFQAVGCNACYATGYKSRIGIFELVVITPELAASIARGDSHNQMEALVLRQGTILLAQQGLEKVCQGITSFDEFMRAIGTRELI